MSRGSGAVEKYRWTGLPVATERSISSTVPETEPGVGEPRRLPNSAMTMSALSTPCSLICDCGCPPRSGTEAVSQRQGRRTICFEIELASFQLWSALSTASRASEISEGDAITTRRIEAVKLICFSVRTHTHIRGTVGNLLFFRTGFDLYAEWEGGCDQLPVLQRKGMQVALIWDNAVYEDW
ncbi:hypothetical protein JF70_15310 [Bifidobacterium mellis]|uniref:Uncharacterized protein n=1 Tax=Bifidobacterium mellis TaxID=1293823 RepID=A0A0F4KXU2_9BIFI|nr:hypothetical protein JF70_15310 [Bifidobacterium mellis]